MDVIIANRDCNNARNFIEKHISTHFLTKENISQMTTLYNSITAENAKEVYGKASDIFYEAVRINRHNFNIQWLRFFGAFFLISGGICLTGFLAERYLKKYFKYYEHIKCIGAVGLFVSFCGVLATGH